MPTYEPRSVTNRGELCLGGPELVRVPPHPSDALPELRRRLPRVDRLDPVPVREADEPRRLAEVADKAHRPHSGVVLHPLGELGPGRDERVLLACEPAACPTLTRGVFAYDFGDTSQLTPLVAMHTLGHDFVPAPIHAGGLRYHGVAPLISQLVRDDLIRAEAYLQNDVFASAVQFAGSEGILPAPEAAHAIHGTLQVAKAADDAGEEKTILFNLSGHGHFDMGAYDKYFAGELEDVDLDEGEIERALHAIEGLPTPA